MRISYLLIFFTFFTFSKIKFLLFDLFYFKYLRFGICNDYHIYKYKFETIFNAFNSINKILKLACFVFAYFLLISLYFEKIYIQIIS